MKRFMQARWLVLAGMVVLGGCLLVGSVADAPVGRRIFDTIHFKALALLVVAGLAVSLVRRAFRARTLRDWGSVLLHASIVLVVGGLGANAVLSSENHHRVVENGILSLKVFDRMVRVMKVHAFYREGRWHKGEAVDLRVFHNHRRELDATIHVNKPLDHHGFVIHVNRHGFAPYLEVRDRKDGRPRYFGYMEIPTVFEDGSVRYEGEVGIRALGLRGTASFTPSADGPFPRDPRLKLVLRDALRRIVFSGELRKDVEAEYGDFTVVMRGAPYWAGLTVRYDPALDVVFAGFWTAVGGAALALLPRAFGRHA